jgi:anaerobic selenocysteine-containing dehydrogenase
MAFRRPQDETALTQKYPLVLLTPANHYFLNSIFANVPRQLQRAGVATIMIHPSDATPRGIATGDEVRIANMRGSFRAVADVTDVVRPGVVASTKGRWPAHAKQEATINATVDDGNSDMGAGALYHDNRVRLDRIT